MGNQKVKVTVALSSLHDASSRYRCLQYIPYLKRKGYSFLVCIPFIDKYFSVLSGQYLVFNLVLALIKVISRIPLILCSHITDITWINRDLIPGRSWLFNLLGGLKVLDVDDAIWGTTAYSCNQFSEILNNVDVVLAGNLYIAEYCRNLHDNVYLFPTVVDANELSPIGTPQNNSIFRVGWIGSRHTIHYLSSILSSLVPFFQLYDDARLAICSDSIPDSIHKLDWCDFIEWSPSIEKSFLQSLRVGLMPLDSSDWEKGKCSFKFIQYMSVGIPSIVSYFGNNASIIDKYSTGLAVKQPSDWNHHLNTLYSDPDLCASLGNKARQTVLDEFSLDLHSDKLSELFLLHV